MRPRWWERAAARRSWATSGAAAVGQLEVQPPVTPVDHPLIYEEAAARLEGPERSYLERLDEAISTDLNTAQALAVLTRVSRDDEIGRDALGVLGAALGRRASHEDQIVNLGLMATDFPQYRLSFDRPE